MSRTITFIRHAETEANAERRWQGSTNAPFTRRGEDQIVRLARRLGRPRSKLIASDLPRTTATASALGAPRLDPSWREFDLGAWEGLTTEEIEERFPGEIQRMFSGEDFAIGGGERMGDFRTRITAAFEALADDLDDGEEAIVVTHGGVIGAVANLTLGTSDASVPIIPSHNTAITRVRLDDDGARQLFTFNDATHLDEVPTQFGPEGTVVTVFRHGETIGNVAGRWQGRSDSDLTERGRWQAARAADHAPHLDTLFTSPLGRAASTAEIIGRPAGLEPIGDEGLAEMAFGTWENLTLAEAADIDPDLFDAIYGRDEDLPRGGDGESFADAGERLGAAIEAIVSVNGHRSVGVVSHGAVIRAFAVALAGLGFAERNRIPVPRNTSMNRFVYGDWGAALASYNVAPHLDTP